MIGKQKEGEELRIWQRTKREGKEKKECRLVCRRKKRTSKHGGEIEEREKRTKIEDWKLEGRGAFEKMAGKEKDKNHGVQEKSQRKNE